MITVTISTGIIITLTISTGIFVIGILLIITEGLFENGSMSKKDKWIFLIGITAVILLMGIQMFIMLWPLIK